MTSSVRGGGGDLVCLSDPWKILKFYVAEDMTSCIFFLGGEGEQDEKSVVITFDVASSAVSPLKY